jgi:Extensin-like protein C-terminus
VTRYAWLALLAVLAGAPSARAADPRADTPPFEQTRVAPAYVYANMTNREAYAELRRRHVPYEAAHPPTPTVRAPIRLTGPLHGVFIHSSLPEPERRTSYYEILDARLALALDDFCKILALHDVVELVHFTMYHPSGKALRDPRAPEFQHVAGLAIDVGALRKRDGEWLTVGEAWPAAIGAKTCGAGGRHFRGLHSRELLSILCEAADARLFTTMLTPDYNHAHSNHFHLEIRPDVRWFFVH